MDVSSEAVSDAYRGQWDLYWTSRGTVIPRGFLPLLDEWQDIDARERRLSIESQTPILIDPRSRIGPRLAAFFRRSRFARLATGQVRHDAEPGSHKREVRGPVPQAR